MSCCVVAGTFTRRVGLDRFGDTHPDVCLSGDPEVELIDFSKDTGSRRLAVINRLTHGGIHIVRGILTPNEGARVGGSQLTVAIHMGEPVDMEWRPPGTDRLHMTRVDAIHINPGDNPFYQRWPGHLSLLVIAFDREVIDRIGEENFHQTGATLRTLVGVDDPAIKAAIPIWQREMDEGGPGGRLFVESLAMATAVHLFRNYGGGNPHPPPTKGGLGGWRLNRVIDYIEAHVSDDLSIRELAKPPSFRVGLPCLDRHSAAPLRRRTADRAS